MSDRARGGLFNALGDITGLRILDAFAGSGALSFEAVSRGADSVLMVENDHAAQKTIERNIEQLAIADQAKLVRASASAWLTTSTESFDVILLDPPYDDLQLKLLAKLAARLRIGGVVVYSLPPTTTVTMPAHYELLSSKNYGDATLNFYRRTE